MTLDLNHDGVKDYIKRNNLELKKIQSKDSLIHNLLRIRDLRPVRTLIHEKIRFNERPPSRRGPSADGQVSRSVDPCSEWFEIRAINSMLKL